MKRFWKQLRAANIMGTKGWNKTPFTKLGEKHEPKDGRRRLTYYQKYFRGYTEVRQLNAKGRVVIDRVYTQPWIVSGLSTAKYWLLRLLYAVLTALSAVLFVGALIQDIPGNYTWVVVVPGYISGLLLFMLVISTLTYIFTERKMTLWGHHSSTIPFKRYSLATAIGQLLTAVAITVVTLITRLHVGGSLLCAGAALLASICSGAMFLIECNVPYKELPNDAKRPHGESHEIW